MEKAGLAAAQIVREQWLKGGHQQVLVLAGPGNNGGDAFVVARYLKEWSHAVTVVFSGDHQRVPPDDKQAIQAWFAIGGDISTDIPGDQNWDVIIDGLFGIGLDQTQNRVLDGQYRAWVDVVNQMGVPIVAPPVGALRFTV